MKVVWNPDLRRDELEFISLAKPWQVFSAMAPVKHGDTIIETAPATPRELVRAHDLIYMIGVMEGRIPNGFGKLGFEALAQLPQILAANGVMIRAVMEALADPRQPVFAPVSGFHHAHYAEANGFCTFNGLLVAIAMARLTSGLARRVLIIDGDGHYGDGTDDIIERLQLKGITNHSHVGWLPRTDQLLRGTWDLVIYQAGADAHLSDPYGVGYLTDEDWVRRDERIFNHCRAYGVPLVFNLAGGYNGQKTIDLHLSTINSARQAYGAPAAVVKALERAQVDGAPLG